MFLFPPHDPGGQESVAGPVGTSVQVSRPVGTGNEADDSEAVARRDFVDSTEPGYFVDTHNRQQRAGGEGQCAGICQQRIERLVSHDVRALSAACSIVRIDTTCYTLRMESRDTRVQHSLPEYRRVLHCPD